MKRSNFKKYIWALQQELASIAESIESGEYDKAIELCDKRSMNGIFLNFSPKDKYGEDPLNAVSYFQCCTSLFCFKAQALMEKIKLFSVQADEEYEALLADLKKAVSAFLYYYEYCGWSYRRKMESVRGILIADFKFISEEEYDFDEWLRDCTAAIANQKKRRGKDNQLVYGGMLMHIAQAIINQRIKNEELIALAPPLLLQALDIYKKYDSDISKIAKISLLLQSCDTLPNYEFNDDVFSEVYKNYIQHLSDDSNHVKKEQALYSQNYILGVQCWRKNKIEEAAAYFNEAIKHGLTYLNQLSTKYDSGINSIRLLEGLTISSIMLFRFEENKNYLLSMLDFWKKAMAEIESHHTENRRKNPHNITQKDILATLTRGLSFDFSEAIWALTAKIYIGICYIVLGDIRNGLECRKDMEQIISINNDIIDDETSAVYSYALYANLYFYYRTRQQTEEAEEYYQLCLKTKDKLRDSDYLEQISVYDQIFDTIAEGDECDSIGLERKINQTIQELLSESFSYSDNAQFEDVCMDVIERIVSIDISIGRLRALKIAQKLKRESKNGVAKNIFERVCKEFTIATHDEYEMLKQQVFR